MGREDNRAHSQGATGWESRTGAPESESNRDGQTGPERRRDWSLANVSEHVRCGPAHCARSAVDGVEVVVMRADEKEAGGGDVAG